jgi:hypothetical protein
MTLPFVLVTRWITLDELKTHYPRKGDTMDNQHRKIAGYRELDAGEIALMNVIKEKGAELGVLIETLKSTAGLDQRWVAIGATDFQTGLMALTRAVAKPTFF